MRLLMIGLAVTLLVATAGIAQPPGPGQWACYVDGVDTGHSIQFYSNPQGTAWCEHLAPDGTVLGTYTWEYSSHTLRVYFAGPTKNPARFHYGSGAWTEWNLLGTPPIPWEPPGGGVSSLH